MFILELYILVVPLNALYFVCILYLQLLTAVILVLLLEQHYRAAACYCMYTCAYLDSNVVQYSLKRASVDFGRVCR